MNQLNDKLRTLSSAEEFMDFFELEYDEALLNVNRLHILKRFNQYLAQDHAKCISSCEDQGDVYGRYRSYLKQAYRDFIDSSPLKERVFKVLREHGGSDCKTCCSASC